MSALRRKNALKREEGVQEELGDGGFRDPDGLSLQILGVLDSPVSPDNHLHAVRKGNRRDNPEILSFEALDSQDKLRGRCRVGFARGQSVHRKDACLIILKGNIEAVAFEIALILGDVNQGAHRVWIDGDSSFSVFCGTDGFVHDESDKAASIIKLAKMSQYRVLFIIFDYESSGQKRGRPSFLIIYADRFGFDLPKPFQIEEG